MAQYGFLIDLSRCIGCNACVISCKQWHDIPPGPAKWMRVYQWEKGAFPETDLRVLPIPCFHCEIPVCAEACPNKAIYKEEKYGAVLVDPEKCTGARKCFEACPYGAPQFAGDEPGLKMSKCNMCIDRLSDGLTPLCVLSCSMRALEFGPIDELIGKYGNVRQIENIPRKDYPPCRIACPAGLKAENYIKLISENKFEVALEQLREATPFVGVLGRVCTHPCELDCRRGQFDDAIAICSLKRFVADYKLKKGNRRAIPVDITKKEKVAVIGSGPAGLQCAYELIKKGYKVTVFESAPHSGGFMRYGIPEYRLPKKILDNEIQYIRDLGVEIKNNSQVAKLGDIFSQGFKAVFMAAGASQSLKLDIPGEDAQGVLYAIDFLKNVNSKQKITLGKNVVVIGGGSVAIDAARTSLRLGAKKVQLICLECRDTNSKDRMLAQDREIKEAEEEGVLIRPSLGVSRFLTTDGYVAGIEAVACISVREENGTFSPKYDSCSALTIDADTVIVAVGQTIDKTLLPEEFRHIPARTFSVDTITLQSSDERVFAGGDLVSGPMDIIAAIASGKEAATSIDRYLSGVDLKKDRSPLIRKPSEKVKVITLRSTVIALHKRKGFAEVDRGFDQKIAVEQANRCLNCGTTVPSVVFKREMPKKQIILWDFRKALQLWQKRHPAGGENLPDILKDISDATQPSEIFGGRNKLVLKAESSQELMMRTTDDE